MATIKQTNGRPTITEATETDLRSLISDWDDPTAYVDPCGRVFVYLSATDYADDSDGGQPAFAVEGAGAEDLALAADIDIVCWM